MKELYGDRRRTQIIEPGEEWQGGQDADRPRPPASTAGLDRRDGGWPGLAHHDDKQPKHSGNDAPRWLVKASTTDTVYFVAKSGRAAAVAAHIIPQAEKLIARHLFHRVSPLTENDSLAAVFALPRRKSALPEETCVITATKLGMIKKSLISELPGPSSQTFVLVQSERRRPADRGRSDR